MSEKSRIWLSSPHMGGNEQSFVNEAFETNWIAPLGPNVSGFEQDLENYIQQGKKVACLTSGTAALHLGLVQLGVSHGDEVLCQSFTFSASANPIVYQGATPIFIDSEPTTWNICPVALEEAIQDRIQLGKKPKAIIAVHLYGMPYLVDEIQAISAKYDIPVLEDAAEALGSLFKGRSCGTFGKLAALSFNGNKIITTSGGGAMVCPDEASKAQTVFLATQARDDAPHYQHSHIGYNYRMSNVVAGIGRGQMQVLDEHVALRRKMHAFYTAIFKDVEGVDVLSAPTEDYFANHWLSSITIDPNKCNGITRESLRHAFLEENIESRPLWKPMHLQPIFENYPYYGNQVCEQLFNNGLCLPSGSNLTDEDRARILEVIQRVFKS